jgi:hypothetical protein
MRRIWVCIVATTIACGKGDKTDKTDKGVTPDDNPVAAAQLDLVKVDDDKLVASWKEFAHPYAFVWVTKGGLDVVLLADERWDGGIPAGTRKHVDNPRDLLKTLDPVAADIAKNADLDDPPPPPPEDEPSGGTGTAMVLEEGKMGKKDSDRAEGQYKMKDSDRAEGQYKMKKVTEDPQLARQQAIEQARAAGILGASAVRGGGAFASIDDTSIAVAPLERLHDPAVIVAPSPGAPGSAIPKVLMETRGGAIAVANHGKLALLAVGYAPLRDSTVYTDPPAGWFEVHVAADGVHVVDSAKAAQTVIAWKGGALDGAALTYALAGKGPAVDVLVADGPTAQQLIDTLVALGGKHARLGVLPGTSEERIEKIKKSAVPMTSVGQPNANGDLDKAIIRRYVKRDLNKIQYCYEKMLLAKPGLKGTVTVQFFIAPTGKVESAKATGVDDAVSSCVAEAIKAIEFPKPKGGGGVQVNYPFTFRPAP